MLLSGGPVDYRTSVWYDYDLITQSYGCTHHTRYSYMLYNEK